MKLPLDDLKDVAANVDTSGLRGKTIVITGATGFIGRWLVETFSFLNDAHDLNARMFAVSRHVTQALLPVPHRQECLCYIRWDQLPDRLDLAIHGATPSSDELAR